MYFRPFFSGPPVTPCITITRARNPKRPTWWRNSEVIGALELHNAGSLALASCLATMQLKGHENNELNDDGVNNDGVGGSSVLESCEELLMAAVEMESGGHWTGLVVLEMFFFFVLGCCCILVFLLVFVCFFSV